jgi:hypothetical protein
LIKQNNIKVQGFGLAPLFVRPLKLAHFRVFLSRRIFYTPSFEESQNCIPFERSQNGAETGAFSRFSLSAEQSLKIITGGRLTPAPSFIKPVFPLASFRRGEENGTRDYISPNKLDESIDKIIQKEYSGVTSHCL